MNYIYIIISTILTLNAVNATPKIVNLMEKQSTRLIRPVVPKLVFTKNDLKVDEQQKVLLRNAKPLNSEKNIFELKENARKEFHAYQFSLVTKKKPAFIDKFPGLNFLNYLFDSRLKINPPTQYPHTSIAYLGATMMHDNGIIYWRGSGFLIGPRVLLTGKHCVESPIENYDRKISFNALFGKTGMYELFDTKAIMVHKHPKRDIALILLDQEVGLKAGALKLSKIFKEKQNVSVIGYPGVKTLLSYFRNHGETEMYGMVGPLLTISDGKITYNLDTSGGQSGGPVSNILTEKLEEYTAYGIHTNGGTSYNIGEAYDDDFEDFIFSGE